MPIHLSLSIICFATLLSFVKPIQGGDDVQRSDEVISANDLLLALTMLLDLSLLKKPFF